jgi:hypothetical protein
MALSLADQVRLRISDRWRWAEETRIGDGLASGFKLGQGAPFSNLSAASAHVLAAGVWSATAASVDTGLGLVTFSAVISAGTAWRASYQWAVFSEEEIGTFTAAGGTVPGAALEAVRTLMFDSLRRAKWAAPDGTEYDDTAAQRQLVEMEKRLVAEVEKAAGAAGGIESWSEQQAYYGGEYGA